ncbi:hypothetical protein [Burkholderia ambifaria]|uniref:hypothetical protein n=1 Tax=Burkholderia ambifaria TaxID=152480 RepID=UPI0033996937
MSYLHDVHDAGASPMSISPRRYIRVLRLELQDLATQAHVHPGTISRAPDSETIQRFLRETLRVLRVATDVTGDVERATQAMSSVRFSGSRTSRFASVITKRRRLSYLRGARTRQSSICRW